MMKKIGILTSGGDCPGLNTAIKAMVQHCELQGLQPIGIRYGTNGLLARPVDTVALESGNHPYGLDWWRQGGTVLGTTNKGNPFSPSTTGKTTNYSSEIIEGLKKTGVEGLIAIGGDGSLDILYRLSQQGPFNLVMVPKTIDNDVGGTEIAIGHDTAVMVATTALDDLKPTAASHSRIMVLEVMGRGTGHIALSCGIAGGADVILIPEIPYHLPNITQHIQKIQKSGRNFALVVVAEGLKKEPAKKTFSQHDAATDLGIGQYLVEKLEKSTGMESRVTVLGHVQRGAPPNARDRLLAATYGVHAVELAVQNKWGQLVIWKNNQVDHIPLASLSPQQIQPIINKSLLNTARGLGICLGDR